MSLVVHWDTKLLPAVSNTQRHEKQLAVAVGGVNMEEILGVPVAIDGTGAQTAATDL